MKILHLVSEKSWRGGEQQIAYLVDELSKLGHSNILAIKENSEFEKHCIEHGLPYHTFSYKNSVDIVTSFKLRKLIIQSKPDIIHVHSSKAHGIIAIASLLGINTPIILSRRVDFLIKSSGFSKWKYNLKIIKKIICVSDAVKEIVIKGIYHSEKAITIYDGVDLDRFINCKNDGFLRAKYKIPQTAFLVGNTSALADHKDYITFVKTADKLIKSGQLDVYFFIIGKGDKTEEIKSIISEKGLGDRVILTGFLNNIPSILQELDIFLMTS